MLTRRRDARCSTGELPKRDQRKASTQPSALEWYGLLWPCRLGVREVPPLHVLQQQRECATYQDENRSGGIPRAEPPIDEQREHDAPDAASRGTDTERERADRRREDLSPSQPDDGGEDRRGEASGESESQREVVVVAVGELHDLRDEKGAGRDARYVEKGSDRKGVGRGAGEAQSTAVCNGGVAGERQSTRLVATCPRGGCHSIGTALVQGTPSGRRQTG